MEFRRNYLAQVVARIDFVDELPWVDKLPKSVVDAARATFPHMEVVSLDAMQIRFEKGSSGGKASASQTPAKEWVFHTVARNRSLRIGPKWFLVVCDEFVSFSDSIRCGVEPVWDAMCTEDGLPVTNRLGLRYINHVPQIFPDRSPRDWKNVVKQSVLSVLKAPDPHDRLVRALGVTEYGHDGHLLRFQFGMHNPDYPGPLTRQVFLLDYDCWTDGVVEPEEMIDHLQTFRDEILEMFHASAAPGLIANLKG